MSDKATGRPWRVTPDSLDIVGANPKDRAFVAVALETAGPKSNPSETRAVAEANAALIVRSVNNAERLAEALRHAAADMHESTDERTSTSACRDGALCYACAALAEWDREA